MQICCNWLKFSLTATKLQAYYNHDNNITVHYTGYNRIPKDNAFLGYITIVKQNLHKTNLTCIFQQTPCLKINVINNDEKNDSEKSKCMKLKWLLPHNYTGYGYPNNAYCEKLIQLKPFQQLYATVTYLHSEKNVDIIRYFNGSEDYVGTRLEQKNVTVFFPHENGSMIKDIKLRFESDGSVQGNGFSVEMEIFGMSLFNKYKFNHIFRL